MPSLEKLHQEFVNNDFVLIGIDIKESKQQVARYVRDNGLSYINLLDEDGKVSNRYGVSSTPMKFIINREGFIIGAALGYRDWGKQEAKQLINELLKQDG